VSDGRVKSGMSAQKTKQIHTGTRAHPEARAVGVGADDAKAVAGLVQTTHGKSNESGLVAGEEVLAERERVNRSHCLGPKPAKISASTLTGQTLSEISDYFA
jgi:hypothetical protein